VTRYIVFRVLGGIGTLAGGSVVAFLLFHLLPGDPAAVIAGSRASPQRVAIVRHEFGLDKSVPQQLLDWWDRLLHFNLGVSTASDVSVTHLLAERLPVTLVLIGASTIVALALTFLFSLGGLQRNSLWDRAAFAWSVFGLAVPTFWLGILLVLLFAVHLAWLPAAGYVSIFRSPLQGLRFLVRPSISYGVYMSAIFTQFLRRSIMDVVEEDFVRTARAKGLRERNVIIHHAAKPALIPFVTVVGIAVSTSLGFAMLVEAVFAYPGFGSLFVTAITNRDYYVVQAGIMVIVAAVVVANIIVDLTYLLLDPRIRYASQAA
jgi:peptide/nickel transport system permease protein